MPSLHCHIPCRCEHCRIVARVQHDVRGVLGDGYTDNEEVRIALARIIDTADAALQVLHRAHRPEQYREEEGDRLPIRPTSQESLPKESLSKKPGSDEASETSTVNPHSGKQMSCDHCHSHGLDCDDSPICEMCLSTQTPCVRRQCPLSRNNREDCQDLTCRYAHSNHLPTNEQFDLNAYMVLPGALRQYLIDGQYPQAPDLFAGAQNTKIKINDHDEYHSAMIRQQSARAKFKEVFDDLSALQPADMFCTCGTGCLVRLAKEENDTESTEMWEPWELRSITSGAHISSAPLPVVPSTPTPGPRTTRVAAAGSLRSRLTTLDPEAPGTNNSLRRRMLANLHTSRESIVSLWNGNRPSNGEGSVRGASIIAPADDVGMSAVLDCSPDSQERSDVHPPRGSSLEFAGRNR